jgi:outer membrane receptor protein involved in Fe transport
MRGLFAAWVFAAAAMPCVAAEIGTIQITAPRQLERTDNIAGSMSIVTGEELRARGARDLRTALSLVSGVEGTPGGDAGPSGTVPAIWGLREADAFLLVVDGVPWGGAFNPATPSVDLNGVERIEVLRGAAPVMFGATSFVGVIHVIHHAPDAIPAAAGASVGSHGSYGFSAATPLPALGRYRQGLVATFERRGFEAERAYFDRYHALYRGERALRDARLRVDGDVSIVNQDPGGSLLLRDGTTLHRELPRNANFNPAGAQLDQQRFHLAFGLDGEEGGRPWAATVALTRTLDDVVRGFLRGPAFANPPDAGEDDEFQADGYSQTRAITDVYLDLHHAAQISQRIRAIYGVDYLHGQVTQRAFNFGYCVNNGGGERFCPGAHDITAVHRFSDSRDFAGGYAQFDWRVAPTLDVVAGIRLNYTRESASALDERDHASKARPSGTLGVIWRAWSAGPDGLNWYLDYRDTYKPLAIDFGPESEAEILQPETAHSYESGAKLTLFDGRVEFDTSVFRMDLMNGLTFVRESSGDFTRGNGAKTRFQGYEIESQVQCLPNLQLLLHHAYHDARFLRFTRDNGADASGNRLEMSPRHLSGLGILYGETSGLNASLIANYVGGRKLNKSNSVTTRAYTSLDASLSYSLGASRIRLSGYNLGNRRDPIAESELSEAVTATGTAAYYRLPGRRFELAVETRL